MLAVITNALTRNAQYWREDALAKKIVRAILTTGGITALVKVFSFGKELLMASRFGTMTEMDAFTSALAMWGILTSILGNSLPAALQPVYSQTKTKTPEDAPALATDALILHMGQVLVLTAILCLLAPVLIPILTANYSAEKQMLTLGYFRGLAPFAVGMTMSRLYFLFLRAHQRFALSAILPVVIPITIALTLLAFESRIGMRATIIGSNIGSVLQLIGVHMFFHRHTNGKFFIKHLPWKSAPMRLAVKTAFPYYLSATVMTSASLIDVGMAAWLDPRTVNTYAYAEKICALGVALTATATSDAFFPFLSDLVAAEAWTKLRTTLIRFCTLIVVATLPILVGIWILSEPIVSILFERQAFTAEDTTRVATVLRWLSLQIPFYILALLGSKVICALLASKFMLFSTVVNLVANIGFNLIFIRFMGASGIALSTALVYAISATMLFVYAFRRIHQHISSSSPAPQN